MRSGTPSRALVIARTDLRQLRQARDFWLPLAIIAGLFFVVLPAILLVLITHVSDVRLVKQLGDIVGSLPKQLRTRVKGASGPAQASYALAVYLFAPLAIIVPLTVSSAVGANTVIGERERGSGEFLPTPPPASARSTSASSSPAWCRATWPRRSASAATRSS